MRTADLPQDVWPSIGVDPSDVAGIGLAPLRDGTGAATARVELITIEVRGGDVRRLVCKRFAPLRLGPHARGARSPNHWAYWRRELDAYSSGVLPGGHGLRAPRLVAIVDDALYLDYVGEAQPRAEEAALALAHWHRDDRTVQQPWFADDQLAQRLAVSDLDWSSVHIDDRLAAAWIRRHEYLTRIRGLPDSITHGDFGIGNLRSQATGVVAIDWGTFGLSPVGFDLAHLALSTLNERLLPVYLAGLAGRFDEADVGIGYAAAVTLVGASRAHWMASRSIPLPSGYADFIAAHQPLLD